MYEPEIITKTVNHAFKILKYCLNDFIKVIVKPSQTSWPVLWAAKLGLPDIAKKLICVQNKFILKHKITKSFCFPLFLTAGFGCCWCLITWTFLWLVDCRDDDELLLVTDSLCCSLTCWGAFWWGFGNWTSSRTVDWLSLFAVSNILNFNHLFSKINFSFNCWCYFWLYGL